MKEMKTCVLLLLLMTLLIACGKEKPTPSSEGTTSAPTTVQTAPTQPDLTVPDMQLSTEIRPLPEQYTASELAKVYWEQGISFGGKDHLTYYISLPSVYPFSADALAVQQEIFGQFNGWFGNDLTTPAKEYAGKIRTLEMPENGFFDSKLTNCFSYCAGARNGVLSILIRKDIRDVPRSQYICFWLDLETGKRLDASAAAQKYGTDAQTVQQALEAYYRQMHSQIDPGLDFFQENLKKTVSDENVAACQLFATEDGTLGIVANIYTPGSASKVEKLIMLEEI